MYSVDCIYDMEPPYKNQVIFMEKLTLVCCLYDLFGYCCIKIVI